MNSGIHSHSPFDFLQGVPAKQCFPLLRFRDSPGVYKEGTTQEGQKRKAPKGDEYPPGARAWASSGTPPSWYAPKG